MNSVLTVLADNNWDMHGDVSSGWMIVMVLFWAAVILGIVWLVRGASGGGWHWGGARKEAPSEILERRFAEGAISVKDYNERRKVIAGETREIKPLATRSERRRGCAEWKGRARQE